MMNESMKIVEMGAGDELLADGLALWRHKSHERRTSPMIDRHAHGFHQVTLLLSSPGRWSEWQIGEERAFSGLAAGHVVVCPAHVSIRMNGGTPFESVSVRLSTQFLGRVAGQIGLGGGWLRPAAMPRDRFVEDVVWKLSDESQVAGAGAGRGLLASSLGTALAVHLLRDYAGEDGKHAGACLSDEDLSRVTWHIENHMDADLSVGRLAALVDRSPCHFIRQFRAATGTTPHQHVIRRRVERARDLLVDGLGIAQAAARVGFSSQSHLHHHVRRLLGVTPGDLARRRSRDGHRP
jgi:AraC family transcriptional regulator